MCSLETKAGRQIDVDRFMLANKDNFLSIIETLLGIDPNESISLQFESYTHSTRTLHHCCEMVRQKITFALQLG